MRYNTASTIFFTAILLAFFPVELHACPKLPGLCYWYAQSETPCPYAATKQSDKDKLKKTSAGWQIELPLDPKLRWRDGHRVEPEDFVLGWHIIRKQSWYRSTSPYGFIRKVQAKKTSVLLTFARPVYDFLSLDRLKPIPSGISPHTSCTIIPSLEVPVKKSPPIQKWVLLVNQRNPYWKHPANRNKLSLILDREKLLSSYGDLFGPQATVAKEKKKKAVKKLNEADPPETTSIEPIEIIFKGSNLSLDLVDKISNALEKNGVRVRTKKLKNSRALQRTLQNMRHRELVLAQIEYPEGHSLKHLLHSNKIPSQTNQYIGGNYSAFQDSKTDELVERLDRTTSIKKRLEVQKNLRMRLENMTPFWLIN